MGLVGMDACVCSVASDSCPRGWDDGLSAGAAAVLVASGQRGLVPAEASGDIPILMAPILMAPVPTVPVPTAPIPRAPSPRPRSPGPHLHGSIPKAPVPMVPIPTARSPGLEHPMKSSLSPHVVLTELYSDQITLFSFLICLKEENESGAPGPPRLQLPHPG